MADKGKGGLGVVLFLAGKAWDGAQKQRDKSRARQAIRNLFLRQIVGDSGQVPPDRLGTPHELNGLIFVVTKLPATSDWVYRYYVEVTRPHLPGDDPDRVYRFYCDTDGQGRFKFEKVQ